MTHLAAEIRADALSMLEWLLEVVNDDVVTCPGGWVKTLKSFMSMMGWAVASTASKWTAASKASFGKSGKSFPRQLLVLAQFLKVGLVEAQEDFAVKSIGMESYQNFMIPTRSNAFAHLNLFGSSRDEEGEMYIDREDRQRVFAKNFSAAVSGGVEIAKKEGGEAGRAAAVLAKLLKEGMADYSAFDDTP